MGAEFENNSAVILFLHHVDQVKKGKSLKDEDRAAIFHICNMVEGAPLAIELSTVWTHTLSYREITLETEKSLDLYPQTCAISPNGIGLCGQCSIIHGE